MLLHKANDLERSEVFGIKGVSFNFDSLVRASSGCLCCTLGHIVAQLRVIFVPNFLDRSLPRTPHVYVQPLKISSKSTDTNMYTFIRVLERDGRRKGQVFPLTRVWQQAELMPKHNGQCDRRWTCDTAVELAEELILNPFFDDAAFIEVY